MILTIILQRSVDAVRQHVSNGIGGVHMSGDVHGGRDHTENIAHNPSGAVILIVVLTAMVLITVIIYSALPRATFTGCVLISEILVKLIINLERKNKA